MPWVFAYGSNMNIPDLKRWSKNRGFANSGIESAEPAIITGHRLVWNCFSGRSLHTWLYVVQARCLSDSQVAPRREFINLMLEAAKAYKLGNDYEAELQQLPTCN